MKKLNVSPKESRTLAETVIVVLLLLLLMTSFIYYFFKQEDNLTDAGFNRIVQTFATKVTTVHAQWYMDKQPNIVNLSFVNANQSAKTHQLVVVNKKGWVDSVDDELACSAIWNTVMMDPMRLLNSPIAVIEVKKTSINIGRICQFETSQGHYFEYNSENGKVIGPLLR